MKIAKVETVPVAIPHEHGGPPVGFGGRDWPTLSILLVRVETEDGLVGWGEAFSYQCLPAVQAMLEHTVAPIVVGRDASDLARFSYELQQRLHLFGRYGVTMFALSGLDIALWDLAAKAAGVPLRRLLGGAARAEPIAGYASLFRYGDPELVAARASEAIAEGYPAVKLHETRIDEVSAARDAISDAVPLCVDTNCPWTPGEARARAEELRDLGLHWLEEPVFPPEDFHALARLRGEVGIPLASGENLCTAFQFRAMFDAGAVDYAQPSVTKVGGVTEFRKVQVLAETSDVAVVPHSPYFGPGWLATLQILAATPNPGWIERFYTRLEATLYPGCVDPDAEGRFAVPDGPGLGAEPDPDVMRTYRIPGA